MDKPVERLYETDRIKAVGDAEKPAICCVVKRIPPAESILCVLDWFFIYGRLGTCRAE